MIGGVVNWTRGILMSEMNLIRSRLFESEG